MKQFCFVVFIAALACNDSHAATFAVTNTSPSGSGSLSNAIALANQNPGLDRIEFNIPGPGVHTISLSNLLPDIATPVVIDGYTQPGSSSNTLAEANNAVLLIEVSGNNAIDGLTFRTGSSNSVVRGLVLNQFVRAIHFNGVTSPVGANLVEGCFIGTTADGRSTKGNNSQVGVFVSNGGQGNRIGGPSPTARNVISGPTGIGIQIAVNSSSNVVQGNFIGVDATGTNALGSQSVGIDINNGANGCLIGGTNAAVRNVIAGFGTGIGCNNSVGHVIQGNFLGTDATGTKQLGNFSTAVFLGTAASDCLVGGITVTPGAPPGNVIAGGQSGSVFTFNGAIVQGNLIGTDATGTRDFGSTADGITIRSNVRDCLIGGTNAGARNVISGHNAFGIRFDGGNATNTIQGNFIGTDITGTLPLPNGSGINLHSATDTLIGPANVIAFNGGDGITSDFNGIRNRVTGNSIFGNGAGNSQLAIDLGADGVLPNDIGDVDGGANGFQNFPAITGVSVASGNVTLSGTLNSVSTSEYRLEFFSNLSCDNGGNGEGQMFLGFTNVTTDASGNAGFSVTRPLIGGAVFTATATDTNGNTSEFSACASVSGPCIIVCPTNMVVSAAPNQCGANVVFFPTTTGNCGGVNSSPPSGSFFPKGTNTVICTTASGPNCSFTIVVTDTTPPNLICPANIVSNVPPTQTSAVVHYPAPLVSDNCGTVVSTNFTPPSGSTFPVGTTLVTSTATDSSGNSNTCSFTVTISTTNTPPIAQCRNVMTNANASCQAAVPAVAVDNGSFDPDGSIVSRTLSPPGPYPKGTNAVTLTVVDDRGDSNSCNATIIVLDTTPPTIACPGSIITNAPHAASSVVVNFQATVTDNCPGLTTTFTPPSGSAFPLGTTVVTAVATDSSGNSNSCAFNVTVNPIAATITWDGGGANGFWTNALNWAGDILPVNGDGLIFPTNAVRRINTNTITGPTNLAFLELSGSNYVIHGPPLRLLAGLTNIPPFLGSNTIAADLVVARDQTWRVGPFGQKTELTLLGNVSLATSSLTVDADSGQVSIHGNLTSDGGSFLKTGIGPIELLGPSNNVSDLRVLDGTLRVNGALAGGLSISNVGVLVGNGTVPPFVCAGAVRLGLETMKVSPGSTTFTSGSDLRLDLDSSASPGSDYGQLKVANPPDLSGATLSFVLRYQPQVGEQWIIISNMSSTAFTSAFAGLPEGTVFERTFNPPSRTNTFQITYTGGDGNDVELTLVGYKATGITRTWSGAGTNSFWTNPLNWVGNVAPNQGDNLLFPGAAARLINTNDFPSGNVFNAITVGASGYALRGSTLRMNSGIHGTFASGTAEMRFGIILTQPQTFTNATGTLNILGPDVDNGGFDLTVRVNGGTVIFADDQHMHGPGGLIKKGPGVLRLAATEHSSYLGVTRVNEGTLELAKPSPNIAVPNDLIIGDDVSAPGTAVVSLDNANQIADNAAVVIASSGILDTDGRAESIGALSGSGLLILGNSFGTTFTGTSTFSGTISGTVGALVKSGSGTLIFAGTNLHSGTAQCSDGTLQVDGVQLSPLTRITSGGRLQGSGFVGVLDINGVGAEIAPGSSPGVLTCSNYNADATGGATLEMELNGPEPGSGYDQLNVRGTVTLTGMSLAASLNYASALSNQFVIINNDGSDAVAGTFTAKPQGFTFAIGSEQFRISYIGGDGNDVVLTQVSGIPAVPRLKIELISPVAVRLMWPTNPPGFNLEFNTNLASPAGWLPESVLPLVVGTNNIVTNATSDAQKLYRLEKN